MRKQVTKCCGYANRSDWEIEQDYRYLVQARAVFWLMIVITAFAVVFSILVIFGLRWSPDGLVWVNNPS
jgi:hypothetical protein